MFVEVRVHAGSRASAWHGRGASFALFVRDMADQARRNLWAWVGCLLLGHDDMMVRAPGRLWLRCTDCGRDTRGWHLARAEAPTHRERTILCDLRAGS